MAGRYAANTAVTVSASRQQIEKELSKYGARGFGYMQEGNRAMLTFTILSADGTQLRIQMNVPLPNRADDAFVYSLAGRERSADSGDKAWEQACRSRWRATLLVLKAKLEACETGISTIEREFMPDLVMEDGRTLEAHLGGQDFLKQIQAGGGRPMLPKL